MNEEEYEKIEDEFGDIPIIILDRICKFISGNYISKDKIREKIKENKKLLLSCNKFSDVDRIKVLNERIIVLEELLEEE